MIVEYLLFIIKSLNKNRLSVFIGITGLMISVLIFIADSISGRKITETEKKAILNKTRIVDLFRDSIMIIFATWISDILNEKMILNFNLKILYIICNILVLILIIWISIDLIKVFNIIIEIQKKTEVKYKLLNDYVKKVFNKYRYEKNQFMNRIEQSNKEINKKEIIEYGQENYITLNKNKEYIESKIDGYIEKYDIEMLIKICENIRETQKKNEEPKIKILVSPGSKVKKRDRIFEINFKRGNENFEGTINYNLKVISIERDVRTVIKDLISMANISDEFDSDGNLGEVVSFLLESENENKEIIDMFLDMLFEKCNQLQQKENTFRDFSIINLKDRLNFLLKIEKEIYDKDLVFSNKIDNYINKICIKVFEKMSNEKDINEFSFYYVTNVVNLLLTYSYKANILSNYDNTLSNVLRTILSLLEEKKYESVRIIAKNVFFNKKNEELNTCFLSGFIKCIVVTIHNKEEKDNLEKLRVSCYELEDALSENNKMIDIKEKIDMLSSKNNSKLENTMHFIEFILRNDKYSNSYFGWYLDDHELIVYTLIALMNSYNFDFNINLDTITENDVDILTALLRIEPKEEILDIVGHKDNWEVLKECFLIPMLDKAKAVKEERVIELNVEKEIKEIKTTLSKAVVVDKIIPFDFINIKRNKKTLSTYMECWDVLEKDTFKKYVDNNVWIIDRYTRAFKTELKKDIEHMIIANVNKKSNSIDEALNGKNDKDYIILANQIKANQLGEEYKYKDRKIKVYPILKYDHFNPNRIILISKNSLPIINTFRINDNITRKNEKYQNIIVDVLNKVEDSKNITINGKKLTPEEKKKYVYINVKLGLELSIDDNHEIYEIIIDENKENR